MGGKKSMMGSMKDKKVNPTPELKDPLKKQ